MSQANQNGRRTYVHGAVDPSLGGKAADRLDLNPQKLWQSLLCLLVRQLRSLISPRIVDSTAARHNLPATNHKEDHLVAYSQEAVNTSWSTILREGRQEAPSETSSKGG